MGLNSVHVKDVNEFKVDQLSLKIYLAENRPWYNVQIDYMWTVNEFKEIPKRI